MSNREALIDKIQTCVLRVERILITSREQHTDAEAAVQSLQAMVQLLAPGAETLLRRAEMQSLSDEESRVPDFSEEGRK